MPFLRAGFRQDTALGPKLRHWKVWVDAVHDLSHGRLQPANRGWELSGNVMSV